MALVPDNLAHCNYPIETPTQIKFWASSHKCNQAKAVIAFSYDEENAHRNMRRLLGWTYFFRKRAWNAFGHFVNSPDMAGIPFSEGYTPYWECMPAGAKPKPTPPTVSITGSGGNTEVGKEIKLRAIVSGYPRPTLSWTYSKDGGSPVNLGSSNPLTFTPTETGTYVFTVTATNSEGTATARQTWVVEAVVPGNLSWVTQLSDTSVVQGKPLTLTVLAKDSKGRPISYAWQDGSSGTTFKVDTSVIGDINVSCTATGTNTSPATITTSATIKVTSKVRGSINFNPDKPADVNFDDNTKPKGSINFNPDKPADVEINDTRKSPYTIEYGVEY